MTQSASCGVVFWHLWLLLETATIELTCGDIPGSPLHQSVDLAYRETSKRLLEVLHTKYSFVDHLKVSVCLDLRAGLCWWSDGFTECTSAHCLLILSVGSVIIILCFALYYCIALLVFWDIVWDFKILQSVLTVALQQKQIRRTCVPMACPLRQITTVGIEGESRDVHSYSWTDVVLLFLE